MEIRVNDVRRFVVTIRVENYTMDDAMDAKEAVAECLDGMGKVWVLDVQEEHVKQLQLEDGQYSFK